MIKLTNDEGKVIGYAKPIDPDFSPRDNAKGCYVVICTHPDDGVIPEMAKSGWLPENAEALMHEYMKPFMKDGQVQWDCIVGEAPVVIGDYDVYFIWHGDDAISALGWLGFIIDTSPIVQVKEMLTWCNEIFS